MDLLEGLEDMNNILYYQSLLYILKIFWFELSYCYYNYLLVNHIEIEKIRGLVAKNTSSLLFIKILKPIWMVVISVKL